MARNNLPCPVHRRTFAMPRCWIVASLCPLQPPPKYVYHALSPESVYLTMREDAKEIGYPSYYSEASCLHGTLLVHIIYAGSYHLAHLVVPLYSLKHIPKKTQLASSTIQRAYYCLAILLVKSELKIHLRKKSFASFLRRQTS